MIGALATLLVLQLLGEALVYLLKLPLPGPVVGMALLLVVLAVVILRWRRARELGVLSPAPRDPVALDAKISRPLLKLDGGDLALALGGELRRENTRFTPSISITWRNSAADSKVPGEAFRLSSTCASLWMKAVPSSTVQYCAATGAPSMRASPMRKVPRALSASAKARSSPGSPSSGFQLAAYMAS